MFGFSCDHLHNCITASITVCSNRITVEKLLALDIDVCKIV